MVTPKRRGRRSYHHGSLGPALKEAALSIIEEDGIEYLSMRALARRAGVSHAAPSHHFESLDHLLDEIAADGFRDLLNRGMEATASGAPPLEQLRGYGLAYIQAALEYPGRFRVMFQSRPNAESQQETEQAKESAFQALVHLMDAVCCDYQTKMDPHRAAAVAWSTVHGFAWLAIDGLDVPKTDGLVKFNSSTQSAAALGAEEIVDTLMALVTGSLK